MSTASSRAADRAHIAEIDAKISSLREAIRALKVEKLRTQERLNSYAYPMLTLPNEITSEIFMKFIPVYPHPSPMTGRWSPITLTHVCGRWREIAHSMHSLWRGILVPDSYRNEAYLLSILESWLSRSGCLPLSISMEDRMEVLPKECAAVLVLHRARWEYVTLTVLDTAIVHTMQGAMPLLRQFEIRPHLGGPSPSPIRFCEAPRLRSVTLWEFRSPTGIFPWSQLTSLTMIYPRESSAILKQAVNLVYCHLFVCDHDEDLVADIQLPVLESLVLAPFMDTEDAPATDFLPALITPALRTLQVPESFLQPDPIDVLRSFILKSGCDLQKLCITGDTRSVSEAEYRGAMRSFQIPQISFKMSLKDYDSYSKKLARSSYKIL
ncbi:hypothetical protein C8R45DRAFT_599524 [Mycena sanguinolenta]|nr:hypothetical protein C8R45DRAFT_599524 [Mycena sanguinolenta]